MDVTLVGKSIKGVASVDTPKISSHKCVVPGDLSEIISKLEVYQYLFLESNYCLFILCKDESLKFT